MYKVSFFTKILISIQVFIILFSSIAFLFLVNPSNALAVATTTPTPIPTGPTVSRIVSFAPVGNVGPTTCSGNQTQLGVPIPVRSGAGFAMKHCVGSMKEYLKDIYSFLIVIASLSAVLMIIWGGYIYITSSGEPAKTTSAKEIIIGAITGLVLLLSASLLISTLGLKF